MYFMMILSAIAGAGIFFAGWYVGHILDQKQSPSKPKRSRPPKCYVVIPGEQDKEQKKKMRKKQLSSGAGAAMGFDESHIRGTDILV